ncbi:hypothetical protein MFIFM68171_08681 [Madurella fahalii]|uniref:Uncharacterized protein n=1 Tax=Madurella fahalii TaxID=1157608 RepID=A0ABQ0GL91_9PEZI
MSAPHNAVPSSIPWHKILPFILERWMLSDEDQCELLFVNHAFNRTVAQEWERLNAKWVPFTQVKKPHSSVGRAIKHDDVEYLEHLIRVADFDTDAECLNGSRFRAHGNPAMALLVHMCMTEGAVKCFDFLMRWAGEPARPFRYDREQLYSRAIDLAYDGTIDFLLTLDKFSPSKLVEHAHPGGLYGLLMTRACSPVALCKLGSKMPPGTGFMPFLLEHCSNRFSHPALIQLLIVMVGWGELNIPYHYGGMYMTPLSVASKALHINVMDVFLRMGVKPFEHYLADGLITAAYNPLFAAVVQELPGKPQAYLPPGVDKVPEEDPSVEKKKLILQWRHQVQAHSSRMRTAVAYLVDAARAEFEGRGEELIEMLDIAAIAYIHTLRTFLLTNLPWQLPPRQKKKMFVDVDPFSRTTEWEQNNPIHAVGYGRPPSVTWRAGLPSGKLRQMLSDYRVGLHRNLVEIWEMLASPNIIDEASQWLERSPTRPHGPWDSLTCMFELIVAADRELPLSPWSSRRGSYATDEWNTSSAGGSVSVRSNAEESVGAVEPITIFDATQHLREKLQL